MNPSYNNGNGSNAGGQTDQPGGIFSRNESGGTTGVSGAAGVPGAKPGVIASGPDPADMPDEKPAGLSLGSNRHLFRRPRAQAPRNFVMNVGGGAGAGMGAGRKSGGPKKGLIIGGLIAIVLVVIILLAVLVISQNKNSGNDDRIQIATGDYAQFYNYANYILSGEDIANINIGVYDTTKLYAVTTAFNKKDTNFFNRADELWKAFYEALSRDDSISEVSQLKGDASYQNDLMDFVVKYINSKDYTEEELLDLYIQGGFDNSIRNVETNYASLLDSSYELGREYANIKLRNAKTALNLLASYDTFGCIKDSRVDNTCTERYSSEAKELTEQYDKEKAEVDDKIINNVVKELSKNCFALKNDLGGEDGSK